MCGAWGAWQYLTLSFPCPQLLNGGGYAEYAVAPEGSCMKVPKGLGLREAASLPEAYCTVWSNVFQLAVAPRRPTSPRQHVTSLRGLTLHSDCVVFLCGGGGGQGLKRGQTILVHGGSSGIGTAAIQLCSVMGSTVFTTAGSDERVSLCLSESVSSAGNLAYRREETAGTIMSLTKSRLATHLEHASMGSFQPLCAGARVYLLLGCMDG